MQFEGYYDTAHHEPTKLMVFHAMDLSSMMLFRDEAWSANSKWRPQSVYVHDTRAANGTVPQGPNNAFEIVRAALPALYASGAASGRMLMWPDGRPGAPHVVGGGWSVTSGRNNVAFYIARCWSDGCPCKFLCANVY
jgi:hypothetical protein